MTIGQRILQARQALGLSQRALAGEIITRNMLSAIEHDKAKPSLETLEALAAVLGKPVGYFLGEQPVEGLEAMGKARACADRGDWRDCLDALAQVPQGDALDREKKLLSALALLALAEEAQQQGRHPYARALAGQAAAAVEESPYCGPELKGRLLRLRGRLASPEELEGILRELPEDEDLELRGRLALSQGRWADAVRYLDAREDRGAEWAFAMGQALYGLGEYEAATGCFHRAEQDLGSRVWKWLQLCYAETKDFAQAYRYALGVQTGTLPRE